MSETCSDLFSNSNYTDFIYRHNRFSPEEIYQKFKTRCVDIVNSEFTILHIPVSLVKSPDEELYGYGAIPKLYTLLDSSNMEEAGITTVFRQPSLAYKGDGTLIGFIDTGIDYTNSLFLTKNNQTRILSIWDQTIPQAKTSERTSPSYGTIYSQEEINRALNSSDPLSVVPSKDTLGHGTFLAGIAAGNTSLENDFTGAAPECSLAIVKLKPACDYLRDYYLIPENAIAYQESDLMMGISWILNLALEYRMPVILYLGLGTNLGNHNGTSALDLLLKSLNVYLGVSAVVPAGNETGYGHHYSSTFSSRQEYDTVELRVADQEKGFILELWGNATALYSIGFVSPSGEVIERIPYSVNKSLQIPFLFEDTKITLKMYTTEIGSGNQLIQLRFKDPAPGIWQIRVYNSLSISGSFNMWLPVKNFISDGTFFLKPDPDLTITNPGNSSACITTSTYNHENNTIYIHSSRGFTPIGRIKPDLAAPGVSVYGPSLTGGYTTMTGSSVAAAHTAGAVANLFSWGIVHKNDPTLNNVSAKSYLIRGASRKSSLSYPNREWGYGTLNLYQSFLVLRESI